MVLPGAGSARGRAPERTVGPGCSLPQRVLSARPARRWCAFRKERPMTVRRNVLVTATLVICAAAVLAVSPAPTAAQAWDAPAFQSPTATDELGLYVFQPPFGDFGLAGIWRQSGNIGLGVRASYLNLEGDESAVAVGAEFFGGLVRAQRGSLFDATWTAGVGATFNDGTFFRVPVGVSAGVRLGDPARPVLIPYVHPRAALEVFANGDATDTEFALSIDIGADVVIGRSLVLRLNAFIPDEGDNAFGAGLAWRFGRGVAVR